MRWKDKDNTEYEGTTTEYMDWKNKTKTITWIDDDGIICEGTKEEKAASGHYLTTEPKQEDKIVFIKQHKNYPKHIKYPGAWTPEEDKIIIEEYPKTGFKGIAKILTQRTIGAIKKRKCVIKDKMLKDSYQTRHRWTRAEKKILKSLWHNATKKQIIDAIPERTWETIRVQATKLKLNKKHKHFTQETRNKLHDRGTWMSTRANHLMRTQNMSREKAFAIASSEYKKPLGKITSAIITYEIKKIDLETDIETVVDCFSDHAEAVEYKKYMEDKFGDEKIRYYLKKVIR